jgi:transposase-like protein
MTDIDAIIEDLKRRADQRTNSRYPEEFRQDAVRLVDRLRKAGWTQKRISSEIEVPWVTLRRWRSKRSSTATSETSGAAESFRPVAIVEEPAAPETETEGVALVSPSGWRIEGLTVTQAVEAARRLG